MLDAGTTKETLSLYSQAAHRYQQINYKLMLPAKQILWENRKVWERVGLPPIHTILLTW